MEGTAGRSAAVRAAVYTLIGEVAESATYVRQRREGAFRDVDVGSAADDIAFEVGTGMLPPDTPFASHGHVLLVRVAGVFQ